MNIASAFIGAALYIYSSFHLWANLKYRLDAFFVTAFPAILAMFFAIAVEFVRDERREHFAELGVGFTGAHFTSLTIIITIAASLPPYFESMLVGMLLYIVGMSIWLLIST